MRLKPLFGNQESLESRQESWNQAKIPKIPESRRSKFRVADPSRDPYGYSDEGLGYNWLTYDHAL